MLTPELAEIERCHLVIAATTAERDDLQRTLERVVANESNHYDRYWTPSSASLTDEWLDETEAKMREALTDAFCDDAAAITLTLIAELKRCQAVIARLEATNERYCAAIAAAAVTASEEIDAPPMIDLPDSPREAWATGYTAACDAIRAALAGTTTENGEN